MKELAQWPSCVYIMIYIKSWQGLVDRKPRRKQTAGTSTNRSRRLTAKGRAASPGADSDFGLKKASLFMNGRSQAVRLPKEFRFEGTHVYAFKDGNRVILMSKDDRMERLLAAYGSAPDFPDRDQGPPQERPELDELFK